MKILISNDDGIQSSGLRLLVKYLGKDNEVFVVAPDCQKSGYSHSMSFRRPMYYQKTDIQGATESYSLTGTPADCVRFAIDFFKFIPDIVIAGPNIGPNLTLDVHYSGTVGAACEGAVLGFKAAALSCAVSHNTEAIANFDTTCLWVKNNLQKIVECDLSKRFLNINIPNVNFKDLKGAKVVPYGKRFFEDIYQPFVSPDDGNVGYCLTGDFAAFDQYEETDAYFIGQNFVTITPLMVNICDTVGLNELKDKFL